MALFKNTDLMIANVYDRIARMGLDVIRNRDKGFEESKTQRQLKIKLIKSVKLTQALLSRTEYDSDGNFVDTFNIEDEAFNKILRAAIKISDAKNNPISPKLLYRGNPAIRVAGSTGAQGVQGADGDQGPPGGAISIQYTFSTTITDSDPGAGVLRLNNATQSSSTVIRADLLDSLGVDWTAILGSLADSTSTIKGHIRLFKTSDLSKWLMFTVSAVATPAGYRNITVSLVDSSSSNPFANNDEITLTFSRTGDKGTTGATGAAGANGSNGAAGNDGADGAVGGAVSIGYVFSDTLTDSDPGSGNLRLNASDQNTSTVIRADLLDSLGVDWTSVLNTFADSDSTIKGHIRLFKTDDQSKWIVFTISAVATPTGYRNITVAVVGSSATSPFTDGDAITLAFSRTGDKGTTGDTGATGDAGAPGDAGADGQDSFIYQAYASDEDGTDFSLTFDPSLEWRAILVTNTEIPTPVVGDFTGLFEKYKGAGDRWTTTSTTSLTIGTGIKTFIVETGLSYSTGQRAIIAVPGSPENSMSGVVDSYNSITGQLTVNVDTIEGSGTYSSWDVSIEGSPSLPSRIDYLRKKINLVAHGFVAKNVLTLDGSGNLVLVSDPSTEKFIGIVRNVIDVDNFELVLTGYLDNITGLTPGSIYYAQTDGTLDTVETSMPVLKANSSTSGYILTSGGGSIFATADIYADITELLATQASQIANAWYLVEDATTDATVDAGWAIYSYKGTTVGDLTDYVKIMEQESLDLVLTGFEQTANKDTANGYVGLNAWKINFRNLANTFTSFLQNAATAARTYLFPDRDITVAGVDETYRYGVAAGTDTYTITFANPAFTAWVTGQKFLIQFTNANTTTTPTLNPNTIGAKTIVKRNNSALVAGDIAAGQFYNMVYDGTNLSLLGIANTGVLFDLLITNQAATSGKKRSVIIDDTGKLKKLSWTEIDETNQKITETGIDNLTTTLRRFNNLSGQRIFELFNNTDAQFGALEGSGSRLVETDSTGKVSASLTAKDSFVFFQNSQINNNNHTADQSIITDDIGSVVILVADLIAGRYFDVFVSGLISTNASTNDTLTFKIKLNSTVIATITLAALATSLTDEEFEFKGKLTIRNDGVSGAVFLSGAFKSNISGFVCVVVVTGSVSIDLSGNTTIDITSGWDNASASNKVVTNQAYAKLLN